MALWCCEDCSTCYSVDAPRCPYCSGTDHIEDGEMPKIHKNRPDTYEPVEQPADDVEPVELDELTEESAPVEPVEEPAPSPRRRTRANAP